MENNRRLFLKSLVLSVGAIAVAPFVKLQQALAEMVNMNDPLVKALGYVANAKDSKDRKDKKANCANCNFYQGDEKAKAAKCQLITSGGDVAGEGWCKSWAARPKKKA
jgi:hypothetical protein